MRGAFLCVAVALSVFATAFIAAEEDDTGLRASPPAGADSNEELLRQLVSSSFVQRDWAARQLMGRAPEVASELSAAVRTSEESATATVALDLLLRLTDDENSVVAAAALLELQRLSDQADTLPEGVRERLNECYRQGALHILAVLTAAGAEITRDGSFSIERISIHSDTLDDQMLALVSPFTSLKVLDLRGSPITGTGLKHLAPLSHLERLVLTDTQISGRSLRALPALPSLRDIALYRTPLSPEDLRWMREHFPNCRINR